MLKINPYATFFRSLKDVQNVEHHSIIIHSEPQLDERDYNFPSSSQVAAVLIQSAESELQRHRHIRICSEGQRRHVKYIYGCYDPLQYPLLFPYGEPGWHPGIEKIQVNLATRLGKRKPRPSGISNNQPAPAQQEGPLGNSIKKKNVTCREYYCYVFQIQDESSPSILRCGRLGQQYEIDMYIKLETSRLDYLKREQQQCETRIESYQGIVDSIMVDGETDASKIGRRIILPASFIGGPRDMRRQYMNAMALVQKYGKPDIFLTMSCNPSWPEIKIGLLPGEEAQSRSDLVARVFRAKLEELKHELINKKIFGVVAAYCYVVEFQKRGLPHAHWLLIMDKTDKIISSEAYDQFVSAELPDMSKYPYLHSLVVKYMLHGPCGSANPKKACMKNGRCRNHYPKVFSDVTMYRQNSVPSYRRRDDGKKVFVCGCNLDNRWVVPYNPYLLAKFDCHINVEICSDIKVVKYLYKHVFRGYDNVTYRVIKESSVDEIDEIKAFQSARSICAPEAMWRIYGFSLSEMHPAVFTLHVHLPNTHCVHFRKSDNLEQVFSNPLASKTMLTEFFWMNKHDSRASQLKLLYKDFPEYFVWDGRDKIWSRCSKQTVVERMITVNPVDGERYYLRLLLSCVIRPTSFEELKTVDGYHCDTFREAALRRGLLDSDDDRLKCLEEASTYQTPNSLRRLFATLLIYNAPTDPRSLWHKFQPDLSEDFTLGATLSKDEVILRTLKSIDKILKLMGRYVHEFSLVDQLLPALQNELRDQEYELERNILVSDEDLLSLMKLNNDQKEAFDTILERVNSGDGGAFFIDGPGGTGKTFLCRALLAAIPSKGDIALAVASSGVATSLLPGGRTAHLRFKLHLSEDDPNYEISKQSCLAQLIIDAKLIIWDEASMAHRADIETLDGMLQDFTYSSDIFGGKTIVFGGDFRQTLPVIAGGSTEDAENASFVKSNLWENIYRLTLRENIRAKEHPDFSSFLLRIGNGTEPYLFERNITIPSGMRIPFTDSVTSLDCLIDSVFPSFNDFSVDSYSIIKRAILAPKNDCVDEINDAHMRKVPGKMEEYFSFNQTADPLQQGQYEDFLKSVNAGGLPPHLLLLKQNCPVLLLKNIDPVNGLCNGTRLICRHLGKNIIGAEIAIGEFKGKYVWIPRMPLEPSDGKNCPISFRRNQFPLKLCFAMTINKAQGQTLDYAGVYLRQPVFSHGQLYVALSRVRSSEAIKVLIEPANVGIGDIGFTKNIVCKEILKLALRD